MAIEQGCIVSGPDDRNRAGFMIEHQVSETDKHVLFNVGVELTVHRPQYRGRRRIIRRLTAQDTPGNRHN